MGARFGAVSSNGGSPRQSTRRRRVHLSASDGGDDLLRDQPIAGKMGFLGAGKMAEAIVGGLPPINWDHTCASDYNPARRKVFKERFGVRVADDSVECVDGADVVVLAVKPQNVEGALAQLDGILAPNCVLISIVAGWPMADLQQLSGCE